MNPRLPAAALCLGLLLAGVASAAETHVLEGTHDPLGPVSILLEIGDANADGVRPITFRTRFLERDPLAEVVLRGTGERSGDTIVVRPLSMTRGAMGGLEGIDRIKASSTVATLTFEADGSVSAFVIDEAGHAEARSEPVVNEAELKGIREHGSHLIAIAQRELEELGYDGVDVSKTFKIDDYLHLGVGAGVRILERGAWSPEQVRSARAFLRPSWVESTVEGGVRVPLMTNIDLGEVILRTGFRSSAYVTYGVTDLYEKPTGITDEQLRENLSEAASRSFDLPLTADEALALRPGAARSMDGDARLAVAGYLQYGRDVADMGEVVRIGAASRIGGFYELRGRMRIAVTRLDAGMVRVHVTRSKVRERQRSADLLVGAVVDKDAAADKLGVGTAFIRHAARQIEKVLRIELEASRSRTITDQVDISYLFDLSTPAARAAYEDAVRGDLTSAAEALDSGVIEEWRVLELEDRTHARTELGISQLLAGGSSRTVTSEELVVEDADGRTTYDVFRFERSRHFDFLGINRKRSMAFEVIRETDPSGAFRRSLRYTFVLVDPTTSKGDAERFRRLMRGLGLDDAVDAQKDRETLFRWAETRTTFTVTIGERGLAAIMAASDEAAFDAYVSGYRAVHGEQPIWSTAAGREEIEPVSGSAVDTHRTERSELRKAETFVEALATLDPAASPEQRAEYLEDLANVAGYRQIAIAALVQLAPSEAVSVTANMTGDLITISDGVAGPEADRVEVHDPRGR